MKRYVFWAIVFYLVASYLGPGALSSARGVSASWSGLSAEWLESSMGGGCSAFMQGGRLEEEYAEICTDEVLHLTRSDGSFRYSPARLFLNDATGNRLFKPRDPFKDGPAAFGFEAKERLTAAERPSVRQLRVALLGQFGGACAFMLSAYKPLPAAADVAPDVLMTACLSEMKQLRPRAWRSLVTLHWRIADGANWTPEYFPTKEQVRRALETEDRVFGIHKSAWMQAATVLAVLMALAYVREPLLGVLAAVWSAAGRLRWPESRRSHRSSSGADDEPKGKRPGSERRSEPSEPPIESAAWRTADPAFRTWFTRHFHPKTGLYRTEAMRRQIFNDFMKVIEEKKPQGFERLKTQLRATFHPDSAPWRTLSRQELMELSQYINQHLPGPGRQAA